MLESTSAPWTGHQSITGNTHTHGRNLEPLINLMCFWTVGGNWIKPIKMPSHRSIVRNAARTETSTVEQRKKNASMLWIYLI